MASPHPEQQAVLKRKRSPVPAPGGVEEGRPAPTLHPGSASGSGSVTQINYLMRAKAGRLRLIEGDSETFADVLGMIDDYEGVLQRHESLAANLGAKLVGPLLLKSFEKLFDGPIKVIQPSFGLDQSPVSWLDIITFARTNPSEFVISESKPGVRACRFWLKGGQVEISEDDYRLVVSGGPERMIPTQAIPEDETAELGTLNILESRLAVLIKKADAVASKARQLNYHLKGRKSAVLGRKAAEQQDEARRFSPQPFSAVNARTPNLPNSEAAKVQKQLLEQFTTRERRPSTQHPRPKAGRISTEPDTTFYAFRGPEPDARRTLTPSDDGTEGQHRLLMASKIEKLRRGDAVFPPCDRCRRLKFDCTKHLTACQACTKKHAKCSWRDIQEGELEYVPRLRAGGGGALEPGRAGGQDAGQGSGGASGVPGKGDELAVLTHIAAAASGR